MFHPRVPCFCYHSIPVCSGRLSRAIHLQIFSRLTGAQSTVRMTYLTLQTFLVWFLQTIAFSPVYLCQFIRLNMLQSYVLFICNVSIPVCPIGSAEGPWTTTQKGRLHCLGLQEQSKFSFVGTHSCLFDPVLAPPTSHPN